MASAFGHALVAITAGKSFFKEPTFKFVFWGCVCSVFPDLDVIMFNFVPYEHFFGHRGFFHSLVFCLILAVIIDFFAFTKERNSGRIMRIIYLFLCGASHGLLDMLTSGGLGIAILSPFDDNRYFFPWRPIKVSPIGIAHFFSQKGIRVLKSEFVWIALPCVACYLISVFLRKRSS
jgi:inner membrane protein